MRKSVRDPPVGNSPHMIVVNCTVRYHPFDVAIGKEAVVRPKVRSQISPRIALLGTFAYRVRLGKRNLDRNQRNTNRKRTELPLS